MKIRMRRILSLVISTAMLILLICPVAAEQAGVPVSEGSAAINVTYLGSTYRLIMNKERLAEYEPTTYALEGATVRHSYGIANTITAITTEENTRSWTGSEAISIAYGGGFRALATELDLAYTETFPTGITISATIPAEWATEYYQIRLGCWHYAVVQRASLLDGDIATPVYTNSIEYLPMVGGTYFYVDSYNPNAE